MYRLFKDLRLTQAQKEQLGDLWTVWETRKRRLDEEMLSAKSRLTTLPTHLPVPFELLSHVSLLSLNCPAVATQNRQHSQDAQQADSECFLQMEISDPSSPVQRKPDQQGMQPEDALNESRGREVRSHALQSPWLAKGSLRSQDQSFGWDWQGMQCLGQDPEATDAAACAMQALHQVCLCLKLTANINLLHDALSHPS
jgi:hypothetical protein